MIPNPGEVVRRQWTVRGLARLAAIGFALVALAGGLLGVALSVALGVTEGLNDDVLFGLFFSVLATAILLGIGATLARLSGRIALWAAPFPKVTPCPRCGYGLEALAVPKCSECGLDLTPEFMPNTHLQPAYPQRPEAVLRHRALFRPIVRLLALLLIGPLSLMAIPLTLSLLDSFRWGDPLWDDPEWYLTALWWAGATLTALGVMLFPGVVTGWLVPRAQSMDNETGAAKIPTSLDVPGSGPEPVRGPANAHEG